MFLNSLKKIEDDSFIFPSIKLAVNRNYLLLNFDRFCRDNGLSGFNNEVVYYKYSEDNFIDFNKALAYNLSKSSVSEVIAASEFTSHLKVPMSVIEKLPMLKFIDKDGYIEDIFNGNGTLSNYSFMNRFHTIGTTRKASVINTVRTLTVTLPFEVKNFLISFNDMVEDYTFNNNEVYFDLDKIFESEPSSSRFELGLAANINILGFHNMYFEIKQAIIEIEDGWINTIQMDTNQALDLQSTDLLVYNKLIYDFEINPKDTRKIRIIGLDGDGLAEIEKNLKNADIMEVERSIKIYRPVVTNSGIKDLTKLTMEALNPSESQIMSFPFNIFNAILLYEGIAVRGLEVNSNTVSYEQFAPDFIDINKKQLGKLYEDGWVKMILYLYRTS